MTRIKKLTAGLGLVAVLTTAVAAPLLARDVIGAASKSESSKMVLKNNGTVKTVVKTTESGGGRSTTTKTVTKTKNK